MIRQHQNSTTMRAYLSITMPVREQHNLAVMDKRTEDAKYMLHKYFINAG